MCGRFIFLTDKDREDILTQMPAPLAGTTGLENLDPTRGDIYPSQQAPIILETGNGPEMELLKWGYENPFKPGQLLINARSETAPEKRMFRDDFQRRRCLIPATGFYEWNPEKQQFVFTAPDELMFLGGLWQPAHPSGRSSASDTPKSSNTSNDINASRFVILTKEPDDTVRKVHNRMPVIIPGNEAGRWLNDPAAARSLSGDYSIPLQSHLKNGQQSMFDI